MILQVTRETLSPATIGRMAVDGARVCDTLELPWRENERGRSCIPPGSYPVTLGYSDKFRRVMIRVGNVPDRDGILIHAANEIDELRGCIACGTRVNVAPDQLSDSRRAVMDLERRVRDAIARGEVVRLDVVNPQVSA